MAEVYVSPSGSDITGDGTFGRPWQTVDNARLRVLALGLVGPRMASDCNVNLAQGTHRVAAKLTHGSEFSGQNGYRLRYAGTGRLGTTRVLGSTRVTGWTVHAGSVWKATVGTAPFYTMWEDGVRGYLARWPKLVFQTGLPMAKSPFIRAEAGTAPIVQYPVGSMDPAAWGSLSQLEMVGQFGGNFIWFTDVVPVQSINAGARQITLTRVPRYDVMAGGSGSQFFMQGALALLTQAGEFFHDRATGVLYYWPRKTGDPNSFGIDIPAVTTMFECTGSSTLDRCHDIEWANLSICNSDFTNDYTYAWTTEGQSGEGHTYGAYDRLVTKPAHRQGLITWTNCERMTLRNVELTGAGYNGLYAYGLNRFHLLDNVWAHHNGNGGIYIDGMYPGEGDFSRENTLRNVRANNCGELLAHGAGFSWINSGFNDIQNVEAFHCAGQGHAIHSYSFGGGGYPTPPAAALYAEGNRVRKFYFWRCNQARGDVGALGVGGIGSRLGGPAKTNYFDEGRITDVVSDAAMYDVKPNATFCDNEAGYQDFRNIATATIEGSPRQRENSADSTGTQTYANVDDRTSFDSSKVGAVGVGRDFPW